MSTRPKGLVIFSLFLILSMVFAACQQATPAPTEPGAAQPTQPAGGAQPTEPAAAQPTEPAGAQPTEPGAAQPTEPAAEPGEAMADVLRFGTISDLTSTNVWALFDDADSSYYNYAVQSGYWPTLFGYASPRYDYVPSLATDFTEDIVQEGERWIGTATLKEGLTWSDGSPLTAADVAFTANTALLFRLGLNWNGAYNPDYLESVEAVDDQTVRFIFLQQPGLAVWQFGALLGPIVSQAYWEPKIANAVTIMEEIQDMDQESEEYVSRRSEAVDILHGLDNAGEPTFGMYMFNRWEVGAFAENVVNPEYPFAGQRIELFENGAYRETIDGEAEFTAYGEPTGTVEFDYTLGPRFESTLYSFYDQDAAVLALRNGDIDFFLSPTGLSQGFLTQLQQDPEITIIENEQNGFRYMAFNYARPHLADPALHQAIACMVNLEFLTQNLMQGQALPAYSPVPPGNEFWHNPDVTKFCEGFDDRARMEESVRILREAGYTWDTEPTWNEARGGSVESGQGLRMPDGNAFPAVSLLAPSAGYDPLRATAAVFIEQWMTQLGIPVRAELTNFNNILAAVYDTGEYDMFILGWGLGDLFPDHLCDFFYGTAESPNPYNYSSETVNTLCDEFYVEDDIDTARDMAFELQEILATELPYIYLFTNPVYDAYRNVEYPFTEILDGIGSGLYGAPDIAVPTNQ